jgi:SAM-dependent methyltransferase
LLLNGQLLNGLPLNPHATGAPSSWLLRHAGLLPAGARVLDVACGTGRNLRWLVAQGLVVTGVDRDAAALESLAGVTAKLHLADIENAPWPLPAQQFDAVLVANYLWRPLWPQLLAAVAPGGVFIMETFAHGQQQIGKPSRPDFLLQPGELLRVCAGLRVVAFEDGFEAGAAGADPASPGRYVQRIVAVNAPATTATASATVPRYGLPKHPG